MANSPVLAKRTSALTFGEAALACVQGEKVTRTAWDDSDILWFIRANVLHIHNVSGDHVLQVSSHDIQANDWKVVA